MASSPDLVSRLVRRTPLRWYIANQLTRMQLIQYAIDTLGARTYLEIGVDDGLPFSVVRAPIKIGVDPIPARPLVTAELQRPGSSYFAMTSDEFFERHAPQVLAGGVDVAFVDGLHTYDQAYRDVRHALRYLNPGGVVLVHDCLPADAQEACVANSYDEARRILGPTWNGLWTGDAWKTIVAIRSGHTAAHACVLDCDHGVGVVYNGPGLAPLSYSLAEIEALDYAALRAAPQQLLGLARPAQLRTILSRLQPRGAA
jgi:hypothetical protein